MIDREELNLLIEESKRGVEDCKRYGINTPGFNQELGWHDCLLYLKEEYFGDD